MFFTLAHEAGHWMLHRRHIRGPAAREAAHFCRARDARTRVEWQADHFASCLLMPEAFVRRAFREAFGRECLQLCNVEPAYSGPLGFDPCIGTWPLIAEAVAAAGGFTNVSRQAMIIRLQELGLVRNETRAHMGWDAAPLTVS
jgi:Zn-dependent peptidase ImmA (M78 family)